MKSGEKKTRARVYVALPTYDRTTHSGASNTLVHALSGGPDRTTEVVGYTYHNSSALCFNYNVLWANFYSDWWETGKADAFAMAHSDIEVVGHPYWEAGRPWLDWVWDQMEERGLACLSVVNAIKSREGHTSVAMGHGPWGQKRLSFKDLEGLPPTFDNDEFREATGTTLLVNTGLMVVKPEKAWANDFQFEFHDRIVHSPEGKKFAMMAPEDWNMSRFFHERNIAYGATTEVKTLHHGTIEYPNWDDGSGLYLKETQTINEAPA